MHLEVCDLVEAKIISIDCHVEAVQAFTMRHSAHTVLGLGALVVLGKCAVESSGLNL